MKILLLGDVHARYAYIPEIIRNIKKQNLGIDVIIQAGDFGFYNQHFNKMLVEIPKFEIPVYAIDGNHEDHEWLHKNKGKWNKWGEVQNVHFVPRGTIKDFGSSTIGFLGGAMNVDRPQHGSTAKRTTNYALNNEEKEFAEKVNALEKPLDLLVTHSCPHSVGVGMKGHPFFIDGVIEFIEKPTGGLITGGPLHDVGEHVLKNLWHDLEKKPKSWVFAHHHRIYITKVGATNFYCVGCADNTDCCEYVKPFIYDTETQTVEWLENVAI